MKAIKQRKGIKVLSYSLKYIDETHELFSICKLFLPGKYTVKAVNEKGTYESVLAVCKTKKLAAEIIVNDLNGKIQVLRGMNTLKLVKKH